MVFVGVAQEKAQAFQGKKIEGQFWFTRDKTVYVNHYYFYLDDADFGPLFLKVCSYAPWSTKLCLNGHEWAKRQLKNKGLAYEALDNGFLSCAEPEQLQQICDSPGRRISIGCSENGWRGYRCRCGGKIGRPATIGISPSGRWK